jgi:light-regulated signal transduction histidine kinase (bacteriophytochrome)
VADRNSFVETNLNSLVSEVLAEMEFGIKEKEAKILVEKLPSLNINPGLMRSLFHNLIGNSLKYSKKNVKPIVRISCEISYEKAKNDAKQHERYCRIYVTDNGIGFDQKDSEQIFSIFKRLHFNNEFEGTGIGLAICKKIADQHNGFISARSKLNEGSTFIVSLPIGSPVETKNPEDLHLQGP